jgi:16S rRNA (uracil1498-N3)-methyltransferase
MRKFFWNGERDGNTVVLSGSEALHLSKVLRLKIGQELILCDENCNNYSAITELVRNDIVKLRIVKSIPEDNEPKIDVTLYLAHTKGDNLDFAVQKSVEIGVKDIKLFTCARCVSTGSKNRLERLNRIALEAAKQSGRSKLVKVSDVGNLSSVLLSADGLKLFCYELATEKISLSLNEMPSSVSVICGPEGGFDEREVSSATNAGWKAVSLGKRILRAETAPLVALTVLMNKAFEI